MKKDNYIVILAWMNELGLSLVEKTVYAIIYGFSQDGDSVFSGSRQYLADWCGCSSLRTIDAALSTLQKKDLITKRVTVEGGVRKCTYVANCTGRAKIAQGVEQNCPGGSAKIAHNNIEDNIDNNIENDTRTRVKNDKKFSFKESLINAGATEEHVDKLLEIRKRKGLNNSQKAYTLLIESINTICKMQGVTVDDVVAFMVRPTQNWGAIRPDWGGVEHITAQRSRTRKTMTIGDLINREMTYYDAAN